MRNWDALTWTLVIGAVALVVVGMFLPGCGGTKPYCDLQRDNQSISIIDGEVSTDRRSVAFFKMQSGYCTAVVVSANSALTAAHCVESTPRYLRIEGEDYPITEYLVHPSREDFKDFGFYGDLALLYTEMQLPGPYARLGEPGLQCYPELLAQGYGKTEKDVWGKLHEAWVEEVGHSVHFIEVSTGPCFGDSGSPLVAFNDEGAYLIGISSFVHSLGCRGSDYPNMRRGSASYINLFNYYEWVRRNMR